MQVNVTIPAVTTTIPAKDASLVFSSVTIDKTKDGMSAKVVFKKIGANNLPMGQHIIELKGADFNNFWTNFNTGGYLYTLLSNIAKDPIVIDPAVEAEFLNAVTPPPAPQTNA